MDSALKQRLLGAAVLIALAAIFLPMLLSGPPPDEREVRLDIPPTPERQLETRRVPLQASDPPARSGELPSLRPANDAGVATVDIESTRPADVFAEDSARAPQQAQTISRPPLPEVPAPDPEPQADAVAVVTPVEPAPAARPQAQPVAEAASESGRFLLQVGTFRHSGNAQALVERLRTAGVPARSDAVSIGGESQTRVVAGPYASRSAAESARLSVRELDGSLNPQVIARRVDPEADDPPDSLAGRAGAWVVQVGSFNREDNANVLRDRLRTAGFPVFVDSVPSSDGTAWRVRVGPEAQREQALSLNRRIRDELNLNGFVVTHP